jgi:HlyD family secretion protein
MAKQGVASFLFRLFIWLVLIGVAAGAGIFLYLREPVYEVTVAPVQRGNVEQTVTAYSSGTVTPVQKSMVAAGSLGTISKVHVEEGDMVEEGRLLVELSHDELDAQVALAEANLKVGESRLEQARIGVKIGKEVSSAQLKQTAAQYELAQSDFDRIKALVDRKAVSQSDFDKVSLALKVAREGKAAADARDKETLVREEEVKSAESVIEQLNAAITAAKAARDRMMVRAPFAGVVAKVILKEGEAVAMGLPLLQLIQNRECYVEAPFDEANAAQIQIGQTVRLTLDAYADQTFLGEVYYIAPVVSLNPDLSRTFAVKIRVTQDIGRFVSGMSADATVIAERKDSVVALPTESILRDTFVYVLENGRAVKRDVKLGIGNWERREVLEGVREGEALITSVNIKGLKGGSKVRVVPELADGS